MNRRLRNQLIVSGIGALLLLLGAVWCITRGYGFYAVVLVTLVCFYIIGMMLWFWSRVSDPVTSLTDAARRIANGSYGVQVEKLGDDEVGDLADAVRRVIPFTALHSRSLQTAKARRWVRQLRALYGSMPRRHLYSTSTSTGETSMTLMSSSA